MTLLDAQPSVLGCMLIEPQLVGPILAETCPDDFTTPVYRMIYEAIRTQFASGEPVDPVTVNGRMGNQQTKLILECMDITPSAASWQAYVALLRKSARMERMHSLAMEIINSTDEDAIFGLIARLNEASVERPGIRRVDMTAGYESFFVRHGEQAAPCYLHWGLDDVDESIACAAGDMIVIGGYPSDGKTSLALNFAFTQAKEHRVGFYSFETDADKLYDRLAANRAQIALPKLKHNSLTDQDWETMARMAEFITKPQLDLIEASGMTVADIRAYAQANRYEVIYVDYLQKIRPSTRTRNASDYENVSQISSDLQQLGRQTGIAVVALSQLSRPEKNRGKLAPRPTLSSLRSSGQIEQDADAVMLLYREEPDNSRSHRVLNIAKNKEGEANVALLLAFDGETQTFRKSVVQAAPPAYKKPEDPQIAMEEKNFHDPF